MATGRKKKLTKKEQQLIAEAMKIVPIQTWQSGQDKLLKMTGDEKRYGGGPTRTTINKGLFQNKA